MGFETSRPDKEVSIMIRLLDGFSSNAAKLNAFFGGIPASLARLERAFAPVTGQIGQLVGAFAGFQVIQTAIKEAEEGIRVSDRLTIALRGNADAIKEISELAESLSRTTIFDDDAVKKLAESLIQRGVPLAQLRGAIIATVETSSRLGISLEQTGEQISQTFGGLLPRSLGLAIPELKNFTEQQLRAGEAARFLARDGTAQAEAFAKTPLGRIAQANNRLNDSMKELGKTLLLMKADLLPAVNASLSEFLRDLNSPGGQAIVALLTRMGTLLAGNLATILKLVAAWKLMTTGASVAFGTIGLGVGTFSALADFAKSPNAGLARAGNLAGFGKSAVGIGDRNPLGLAAVVTAAGAAAFALGAGFSALLEKVTGVEKGFDSLGGAIDLMNDSIGKLIRGEISAADVGDAALKTAFDLIGFDSSEVGDNNASAYARLNAEGDRKRERDAKAARERTIAENRKLQEELAELEKGKTKTVEEQNAKELEAVTWSYQYRLKLAGNFMSESERLERQAMERRLAELLPAARENETALAQFDPARKEREWAQYNALLRSQKTIMMELVPLQERYKRLKDDELSRRLQSLNQNTSQAIGDLGELSDLRGRGIISGEAAEDRMRGVTADFYRQISELSAKIDGKIRDEWFSDADAEILKERLRRARQIVEEEAYKAQTGIRSETEFTRDAQIQAFDSMKSAGSDFFFETAKNFNNIREAAVGALQSIGDTFLRIFSDRMAEGLIGLLFGGGGPTGGIGGIIGGLAGVIPGFATGGIVTGGTAGRDSVLATLTPGEIVLNGSHQRNLMRLLSAPISPPVQIPAAQTSVGQTSGGGQQVIGAVVAPTEANLENLLNSNGGQRAFQAAFMRNVDVFAAMMSRRR